MKKVVILLSGGLDSSTVLAMLNIENVEIYGISFNYSQNHAIELDKIQSFIRNYNVVDHRIVNIDLSAFTVTPLINKDIDVPKYNNINAIKKQIPITYVPARNTIFLSYALGYAEIIGAEEIYIGAHLSDADNYPDCRARYIESFENMANLATKSGVEGRQIKIKAPLINMSKAQIVEKGLAIGTNYSKTISCYEPSSDGESCGQCLACQIRLDAFAQNNAQDPIKYK